MADVTLSGVSPIVDNVTLGSSNVVQRVLLPKEAKVFSVYFRSNAGKVSWDQALSDGGALGSSKYCTVAADTWFSFAVNGDRKNVFLASATWSTVVEILVES